MFLGFVQLNEGTGESSTSTTDKVHSGVGSDDLVDASFAG